MDSDLIDRPAPQQVGIVNEWPFDDPVAARAKIFQLQDAMAEAMKRGDMQEILHELPLSHSFIGGAYAREMKIPAGTLIIGKIHRYSCFNFVTTGHITVLTETGVKEIKAPASFVSGPGIKRVGYVHEDTTWTTVHVTEETDPAKLEEQLTVPDFAQLEGLQQILLSETDNSTEHVEEAA